MTLANLPTLLLYLEIELSHDSTKNSAFSATLLTNLSSNNYRSDPLPHNALVVVQKPHMKSSRWIQSVEDKDSSLVLKDICFCVVKHHLLITLSSKITKRGVARQTHLISMNFSGQFFP